MSIADPVAAALLLVGCFFYLAGTVGLLRFPDVFCRLHALTKVDNLGLLFVCLGLAVHGGAPRIAAYLLLIWLLNLLASTTSCHLIARHARREEGLGDRATGGKDR